MGEKLIVGPPIDKGLKTNRLAFAVDNDSFPTLVNAYQWRGRVKRKRGESLLTRLNRGIVNASVSTDGSGNFAGNPITILGLEPTATIVFNSIVIGTSMFSDTTPPTGVITGSTGGTGTINYATGALTITGAAPTTIIQFNYYPDLPVMGLEDLILEMYQFPQTIGFDTKYAYNITNTQPAISYDVSWYKNTLSGTYPNYVKKTNSTALTWAGNNYQQFWTVNYLGALWATNGIDVPFTGDTIGMQFGDISGITIVTAGNGTTIPAVATITIIANPLVVGDFVFINEVTYNATGPTGIGGINWQTGYVTATTPPNSVTVTFPYAILSGTYTSGGIAQYLTNTSDSAVNCIRWYDGDPTGGGPPTPRPGFGWVNFMPPLSESPFSIADHPEAIYYLVGARMIVPFKDRLLFLGPVIQTSTGSPLYLEDSVIYSQNGTPYYTSSFNYTGVSVQDPTLAGITFNAVLVPPNQTATAPAWFEDTPGFGGSQSAGVDQPIVTVGANEDVLIIGFDRLQTRFVYTGNDIIPFNFFIVNAELGSSSTFSSVIMDKGVITRGNRGIVVTAQTGTQRIDLEIPDSAFEINLLNNGTERFCAQRDYITEWIYFTYVADNSNSEIYSFPNQTLQFNYRDNSWGIFNECYTTYGQFRPLSGYTWQTIYLLYATWDAWNDTWDTGDTDLLQPVVIAGNQQGFVFIRNEGTGEPTSLYISSISLGTVTCPNHCLNEGDYIQISGVIGTMGQYVNGLIFSVSSAVSSTQFTLNPTPGGTGTYLGGGLITRFYLPLIQTKQFPMAWQMGRKTRIGPQMYLFTATASAQIQLLIYLSQNATYAYNQGNVVPVSPNENNSLIYSNVLYTCPESTNLGLTPANTNLQQINYVATGVTQQAQMWHRMNTSLIGDTVQIGFTMSDSQMRELDPIAAGTVITGATQANPCVLTCAGGFSSGSTILITGMTGTSVANPGMMQLNNNIYSVASSTATTVTIGVDSTNFDPYVSGGLATPVGINNQIAEIEFHSMILDLNPSSMLT